MTLEERHHECERLQLVIDKLSAKLEKDSEDWMELYNLRLATQTQLDLLAPAYNPLL
jgi:hypothetical protein